MYPYAGIVVCSLVTFCGNILSMEVPGPRQRALTGEPGGGIDGDRTNSETGPPSLAGSEGDPSSFQWTVQSVILSVVLFVLAGIFEIGGGWLVWKAIREGKPYWWAILGSLVVVGYGFIPTLQPTSSFGRLYAVYGGFFIVLSFLWGWLFDGDRPDVGDAVGGAISLVGVLLVLFWPR
jgi:drug/metabolite transporter superfamily protein YnfA